jgi:8-oxo-dGTP diphosphatase
MKICDGLPVQNYVVGFIYNKDKTHVALLRKDRPKWQAGLLNGIGGKIDGNESAMEAMVRECKEETTQSISDKEWTYFAQFGGDWGTVFCFSAVFDDLSLLVCEESENIEVINISNLQNEKTAPNIDFLVLMSLTDNIIEAKITSL